MYTLTTKGGSSYTLRPEMTASVVRSYLQHHLGKIKSLQKLYYIAPMFRHEAPQSGRYRQFHQYGVEIIGTQNPSTDVEIITVGVEFLRLMGVQDLTLKLNSVGCHVCRPGYKKQLQKQLKPVLNQLCKDCQNRFETNPLRILDCKNETCRKLVERIDAIDEYLCDECSDHFKNVTSFLSEINIPFEKDKYLVRGLDYYTKTAFEIVTTQLGAQDAIVGGGRYDLLAEELGGENTPAVGFAAGIERLISVMEKCNLFQDVQHSVDLYLIGLGDLAKKWIYSQAIKIRRKNLICELDYLNRSLKAQMREANKLNAKYVVIVGENELEKGMVQLKDMKSGEQFEIAIQEFSNEVMRKCSKNSTVK
jgi:histidyl-tRNA synthetase